MRGGVSRGRLWLLKTHQPVGICDFTCTSSLSLFRVVVSVRHGSIIKGLRNFPSKGMYYVTYQSFPKTQDSH